MAFYDNFHTGSRASKNSIGDFITRKQNEFYLRRLHHTVPHASFSILEIGPGKGEFARVAGQEERISYKGVEINQTMTNNLRAEGYDIVHGGVPPFPFSETFDAIFMDQVFEHMEDRSQAITMITSCWNALNEGGMLLISSPEIRLWGVDFFAGDYTHNWPTSLENTEQILTDHDFAIVESHYIACNIRGALPTTLIAYTTNILYHTGILYLTGKAFKLKTVLFPSFTILARKKEGTN